jgi:ubiquitin carboxyl-terminal hydrolase 36/42
VALLLWSHVQITCDGVDYTSSTFDPFLDLSLEITKAHSLTRALQHFTAAEVLDGDNKYRCPKNNKLVGESTVRLCMHG